MIFASPSHWCCLEILFPIQKWQIYNPTLIYILVRSDNKQYDCPHQTNTSCVWYSDNSKDRLRWNMPYSMGILVSNEITKDQVITTFVQDTESIGMSLHAIVWQWTNFTLTELRKHQVLYPRKLLMLLEKTERI